MRFLIILLVSMLYLYPAQADADATDSLTLGIELFQQEKYEKALKLLLEAIDKEPGLPEAHLFLGLTYSKLARSAEALSALQKASELDPQNPAIYLNLGITHYSISQFEAALNNLERALELDLDDASVQLFTGLSWLALEENAEAIGFFNQARKLDSEFEELALFNVGLAYFKMESFEAAKTYFQQVIQSAPNSETAEDAIEFLEIIKNQQRAKRLWSVYANVGWKYDNNVVLEEQDVIADEEDTTVFYNVGGALKFYTNNNFGIKLGYDFYQSLFDDLPQFDYQSHYGFASAYYESGKWDFGLNYSLNYNFLDRKDFLAINNLTPRVGFAPKPNMYTSLSYSYQDKNFLSDNSRDGPNHSMGFNQFLFFMENKAFALVGYRMSLEDTQSSEFDYIGHSANAGLKVPLSSLVTSNLNYYYNFQNYKNVTASIGERRFNESHTFQVIFKIPVFDDMDLKLDLKRVLSNSNLRTSDYDQKVIQIGLNYRL